MPNSNEPVFFHSMKGKVLLGFFIACMALAASWFTSKMAFRDMLSTVRELATPNDKLLLVNRIFKDILQLDHLHRSNENPDRLTKGPFLKQSARLLSSLDTLRAYYEGNSIQIGRIDSMKRILRERDRVFSKYLKVRSGLVNSQVLTEQADSIAGLIGSNAAKLDSTVITTQKRTVTTTVYEDAVTKISKPEPRRSFINKLFGTKKKEVAPLPEAPRIVEKQEVNIQVDTLAVAREDTIGQTVSRAIQRMEAGQRQRTRQFLNREQELARAGNAMVGQLLTIMREVEYDVVQQVSDEALRAHEVVTHSADRIEWIMVGFLFIAALMAYLIFSDIAKSNSYRRQLEEARDEAEYHSMAKQRFLSNMSHEIRTPLQSIIGYSEILKRRDKPGEEELDVLYSSSTHLLQLVNEVLDYSRIVSGQLTFVQEPFAITPLLEEVVKIVNPEAQRKGLDLSLENPFGESDYLVGDAFRLRQILSNLLSNAVKFTENGFVTLKVTLQPAGDLLNVRFGVSDTGIGMTQEETRRIFNEFEQANSDVSRQYGGTGLGLSIVKALVEGQQGKVEVESTPGQGTSFWVSLCFAVGVPDQRGSKEAANFVTGFKGKVWLVDDDLFILQWYAAVMAENQIQYRVFSSGEEVLAQPWDEEVTAVVMDMRMPGMNGDELHRRLKERAGAVVKFYLVTAQVVPEEKERLLESGFDGILLKPFRAADLLRLIQTRITEMELTTEVDEPEFDLDYYHSMSLGDEALLGKALGRFIQDSRADSEELVKAIESSEKEKALNLLHRLAGRTGQIGARTLSSRFRSAEQRLRRMDTFADGGVISILAELQLLTDRIEEKVAHLI